MMACSIGSMTSRSIASGEAPDQLTLTEMFG